MRVRSSQTKRDEEAKKPSHDNIDKDLSEPARQLRAQLVAELPECTVSPEQQTDFHRSLNMYWDQKACEVPPACVVRPRNAQDLSQAVKILSSEFEQRRKEKKSSDSAQEGIFAIRGGGHSPVVGASSINGGVVIDTSLFNSITLSPDKKSVTIGAGCKWTDVSQTLEKQGLAVAGGRNSAVGVGGLTLGGGISFFSSRYGFVCSNIIEYEIVLADGSKATASATRNPDLWRALKGGSNNFGIVTRFTARAFPSPNIWSGFLYIPPFEAPRVLSAFHDFVNRVIAKDDSKTYDEHAAGPLACFTYLQQLGIQAIAVNLVNTAPPANESKWPTCWQNSGFPKLWRFWSTCAVRSLTSATDEMSVLNPPGRRQEFATTTIKNDKATLEAVHKVYRDGILTIRKHAIKELSWTLVLQPLLPDWARKGDPNVLGLASDTDEPLVIVSFTVNWKLGKDDALVQNITRTAIEQIDAFAKEAGTAHRYRFMNYCGSWQKPFEGYGEENLEFLRGVSRRYDPEGLFQRGCAGGFKLN